MKSALARQGSISRLQGPREFDAVTDESFPRSRAKSVKSVKFDKTDEVIQYVTPTPEITENWDTFSLESCDSEMLDRPLPSLPFSGLSDLGTKHPVSPTRSPLRQSPKYQSSPNNSPRQPLKPSPNRSYGRRKHLTPVDPRESQLMATARFRAPLEEPIEEFDFALKDASANFHSMDAIDASPASGLDPGHSSAASSLADMSAITESRQLVDTQITPASPTLELGTAYTGQLLPSPLQHEMSPIIDRPSLDERMDAFFGAGTSTQVVQQSFHKRTESEMYDFGHGPEAFFPVRKQEEEAEVEDEEAKWRDEKSLGRQDSLQEDQRRPQTVQVSDELPPPPADLDRTYSKRKKDLVQMLDPRGVQMTAISAIAEEEEEEEDSQMPGGEESGINSISMVRTIDSLGNMTGISLNEPAANYAAGNKTFGSIPEEASIVEPSEEGSMAMEPAEEVYHEEDQPAVKKDIPTGPMLETAELVEVDDQLDFGVQWEVSTNSSDGEVDDFDRQMFPLDFEKVDYEPTEGADSVPSLIDAERSHISNHDFPSVKSIEPTRPKRWNAFPGALPWDPAFDSTMDNLAMMSVPMIPQRSPHRSRRSLLLDRPIKSQKTVGPVEEMEMPLAKFQLSSSIASTDEWINESEFEDFAEPDREPEVRELKPETGEVPAQTFDAEIIETKPIEPTAVETEAMGIASSNADTADADAEDNENEINPAVFDYTGKLTVDTKREASLREKPMSPMTLPTLSPITTSPFIAEAPQVFSPTIDQVVNDSLMPPRPVNHMRSPSEAVSVAETSILKDMSFEDEELAEFQRKRDEQVYDEQEYETYTPNSRVDELDTDLSDESLNHTKPEAVEAAESQLEKIDSVIRHPSGENDYSTLDPGEVQQSNRNSYASMVTAHTILVDDISVGEPSLGDNMASTMQSMISGHFPENSSERSGNSYIMRESGSYVIATSPRRRPQRSSAYEVLDEVDETDVPYQRAIPRRPMPVTPNFHATPSTQSFSSSNQTEQLLSQTFVQSPVRAAPQTASLGTIPSAISRTDSSTYFLARGSSTGSAQPMWWSKPSERLSEVPEAPEQKSTQREVPAIPNHISASPAAPSVLSRSQYSSEQASAPDHSAPALPAPVSAPAPSASISVPPAPIEALQVAPEPTSVAALKSVPDTPELRDGGNIIEGLLYLFVEGIATKSLHNMMATLVIDNGVHCIATNPMPTAMLSNFCKEYRIGFVANIPSSVSLRLSTITGESAPLPGVGSDGTYAKFDLLPLRKSVFGRRIHLSIKGEDRLQNNVATLMASALYVPTVSQREKMPGTLASAEQRIAAATASIRHKSPRMVGMLRQYGGDILQRKGKVRLVLLDPISPLLVVHSSRSKRARSLINLAKATKVTKVGSESMEVQFRNKDSLVFRASNELEISEWINELSQVVGDATGIRPKWIDAVLYNSNESTRA